MRLGKNAASISLFLLAGGILAASSWAQDLTTTQDENDIPVSALEGRRILLALKPNSQSLLGPTSNSEPILAIPAHAKRVNISLANTFAVFDDDYINTFRPHCVIELIPSDTRRVISTVQEMRVIGASSGASDLNRRLSTAYLEVASPHVRRIFCHYYGDPSDMKQERTVGDLRRLLAVAQPL